MEVTMLLKGTLYTVCASLAGAVVVLVWMAFFSVIYYGIIVEIKEYHKKHRK